MPSNERWRALVRDPAALLGVLFDHMPMGIALFDREGTLLSFNPTWAALIEHYGPPELHGLRVGLSMQDVLGPHVDSTGWYERVYRPVLAGETVRREAIRLTDGARSGWLDFVHAPVREDGDIVGFVEVCVDVTERVLADERARHLAAIVDSSNDAVVGGDLDGRIISWNHGAERLYGYTADEAIGRSVLMLYPPDEELVVPSLFTRIAQAEAVEQVDVRRIRKNGEIIDVSITYSPISDASGTLAGVSSITRDITERKRAEGALREREEQYRSIFETSSDGLSVTALDGGHLVAVNPAFCQLTGYSREELLNMRWTDVVPAEQQQAIRDVVPSTVHGGDFRVRSFIDRRDGTRVPVELHGVGFTYLGQPALLGVVRDISEHMRSMELLEERVEERTREITSLLEITRSVSTALELDALLDLIFGHLNQFIVEYAGATIWQVDDATLRPLASTSDPHQPGQRRAFDRQTDLWRAFAAGEPLVVDTLRGDDPLNAAYGALLLDAGPQRSEPVQAWAGIPMLVQDRLVGILAVLSAEPGFFIPRRVELLGGIAGQAAVAMENIRLLAEAQGRAALEERQRLARELHDSVSQALYGIALGAKTARALLDRDPARVAEPLDYVLSLADAGLAEMRALIFELRPESLAQEGLVVALEKLTDALQARHRIRVRTSLPPEPDAPLAVEEMFYRIAQEALHNTVKHAKAGAVDLRLIATEERLLLEIRDDGRGFDPTADFPGHLGLRSMRERAGQLGAALTIESSPGAGTLVRLESAMPGATAPSAS